MLSCLRGRTYIPSLEVAKEIHCIRGVVDGCYNDPVFTEHHLLLIDSSTCYRTVRWGRVDRVCFDSVYIDRVRVDRVCMGRVCIEREQRVDDKEGGGKDYRKQERPHPPAWGMI